jgi:PleD family two-component response regulator
MSAPPKILIVEDSIVSAMMMEATINRKKPDFQVRVQRSLSGGFEELATFDPDLVILDAVLPDATAEETLAAIGAFRRHARVLVVSGDHELKDEALRNGANDFMGKSIGENAQPFIDRISALVPPCVS